jgi:hypothetical protein
VAPRALERRAQKVLRRTVGWCGLNHLLQRRNRFVLAILKQSKTSHRDLRRRVRGMLLHHRGQFALGVVVGAGLEQQ